MTDGRTLHDGIRRAYAYYHAAKIIYSVFQKKWATFIFFTTTLAIAGYSNVNVQERLTSDNQSVTYVSSVSLSH